MGGKVEFSKEMREPGGFSTNMSKRAILSFSTGTGDSGLLLGGPRDKVGTQEDTETSGGATGIRATSPVCIGVSGERKGRGGGTKEKAMIRRTLEITQDSFGGNEVRGTRLTHELSHMMYSIGDVRASEGEILEGAN